MTMPPARGVQNANGPERGQSRLAALRDAALSSAGLTWSFALAYLVGVGLMIGLIIRGDVWGVLASTRMLDWLMRTGIVARTDADLGFIQGVPDHDLYLMATDAVDYPLVILAIGLFVLIWLIKAVQFHAIAQFCGIDGSLGQHVRAYSYGNGVGHLLPFNVGAVATASALEGQDAPPERAALAVYIARLFVIFEIVVFALIGLYLLGWTTWLSQLFWAFVFLGIAYIFMRQGQGRLSLRGVGPALRDAGQIVSILVRQPMLAFTLVLQSLVAFALVDIVAYFISQAYTGTYVLLNVEPRMLLMGVVASYIARMVQVTPGGIGQAEWGFAMALYVGGEGFGAAAAIALLWGQARYISMFLVFGIALFRYGVETNLGRVLAIFRGAEPDRIVARPFAAEAAPAD